MSQTFCDSLIDIHVRIYQLFKDNTFINKLFESYFENVVIEFYEYAKTHDSVQFGRFEDDLPNEYDPLGYFTSIGNKFFETLHNNIKSGLSDPTLIHFKNLDASVIKEYNDVTHNARNKYERMFVKGKLKEYLLTTIIYDFIWNRTFLKDHNEFLTCQDVIFKIKLINFPIIGMLEEYYDIYKTNDEADSEDDEELGYSVSMYYQDIPMDYLKKRYERLVQNYLCYKCFEIEDCKIELWIGVI